MGISNNFQPVGGFEKSSKIPNENLSEEIQKTETKSTKRPAKKILVVDDNPIALKEAESILKKARYEVIALDNPKFIFKVIKTERPDVVVLDIIMPPIDGYTICAEIKKLYTDKIPVLLCTAQSYEQDLIQKMHKEFGADDYALKPLNAQDFLQKIKTLAKKRKKLRMESLPDAQNQG